MGLAPGNPLAALRIASYYSAMPIHAALQQRGKSSASTRLLDQRDSGCRGRTVWTTSLGG
ncbi:hypothetical protein [Piscinibacter sp.]|uniref:hypothetical protein n=1 Tax=Piscinibacter sp. TaxID=1903157 RepID=UPI0025E09823|nr:hypothetical protein [Piscinibacter sp.]